MAKQVFTGMDDLPLANLFLKILIVIAAFLVFDLVTSYFFVSELWYWVGLIVSGALIGGLFDYLPNK